MKAGKQDARRCRNGTSGERLERRTGVRERREWAGERSQRLPRGERLGATLYEIDPGRTTQLSVMALTNPQFGMPLCGIRTLDEPGR